MILWRQIMMIFTQIMRMTFRLDDFDLSWILRLSSEDTMEIDDDDDL